MVAVNVYAETQELTRFALQLTDREIAKATSRAINRALSEVRSSSSRGMKKLITTDYRLPSSHVTQTTLKIKGSTQTSLTGQILGEAYPESLAHFPATAINIGQRTRIKKQRKGYNVKSKEIKRGKGQSGVFVEVVKGKKENIKTGFMIYNNGKPLIMARGQYKGSEGFKYGKKRLPISRLNTKSIYWAVMYPKEAEIWQPFTLEVYLKRAQHELTTGIQFGS